MPDYSTSLKLNMKQLLLTIFCVLHIGICFSQIKPITFEGSKTYPDNTRIAYFNVSGKIENIQAVYIQKEITQIPGIYKFHMYAGDSIRRCMIKCADTINESIIHNSIISILDNFNKEESRSKDKISFYCTILQINNFPQFQLHESNKENYEKYKNEIRNWIIQNPNEYTIMQQPIDEILNQ